MLGTSAPEYGFIRACILFLQSIPPLSLLYCAAALTGLRRTSHLPTVIEVWLAAESAFWACFFLPYRSYLQRPTLHPPRFSKAERRKLVSRVLSNVDEHEGYIRGWFMGATFGDIGRDDVKRYLAWAFFDRGWIPGEDEEEIEEYVLEIESMMGKNFRPGRGKAKPLRLTVDPVDMRHRSLLWHLCVGFVDLFTYLKLQHAGFQFHRLTLASFFTLFPFRPISFTTRCRSPAKHLTYWCRPHTSKNRLPILFIHGIGIGLYPYTNFLAELNAQVDDDEDDGQVGILAVELMPISFRITQAALSKDEMCAELHQIVAAHGYHRFVLITHSYGSVIATHMLSNASLRPMIASALLIDPVCFLLHMPDVAYNFTARKPRRANEWQLWYFASMDPDVAHTLGRRFFWRENVMWKEDVEDCIRAGIRITVSLSGRDIIVNTEAVGRYLTVRATGEANGLETSIENVTGYNYGTISRNDAWKNKEWSGKGLEVLWFDDLDHAQVFDRKAAKARLAMVVWKYCDSA